MTGPPRIVVQIGWAASLLLAAVAGAAVLLRPHDAEPGAAQAILYIHLPAALNMFLVSGVVFVSGLGYLATRHRRWDALAVAAAQATVACGSIVLLTGMIWARTAWGVWWMWSPRLTFSLMLWLLYLGFLATRGLIAPPERRALVCAVYALVAFLDVPLLYLSVKLLPDVHPSSISLSPEMKRTLMLCVLAMTALSAAFILARSSAARAPTIARDAARPGAAPAALARPPSPRGLS